MPDQSGISPPYLDPSQYPAYLDMQRKQMLASMLMQNAQQSNQTPANWDSMKVVPRRSALSSVSSMLGSYLAGNAMKGSQQAQQKYFQGLYGGGDSQPQSGTTPPPAPAGAPADASGAAPMTGAGTPPQSSQSPLIPSGMSRGQAQQLMGLMGPEKYGESVLAPNLKPAEIRAQIRAAGIDPDSQQGRAMALAALNKGMTTDVRPGGTLVQGTKPVYTAPQGGVQTTYDANGQPRQSTIPGAPEAAQASAAATTAGTESQKPIQIGTDANGQAIFRYPTPPAAVPTATNPGASAAPPSPGAPPGAPTPTAAPPRNYFPGIGSGQTASPATLQAQRTGAQQGQEYAGELSKNATGATEVRRSLSELKNLATQATPAASNAAKMKLGSYMIAAGASPQSVSGFLGVDIGALQAAQKQTATLAVNTIHSMTSRGTNFDLETFMRNNPNLNMSDASAFNRVVDYMDNKSKQEIAKQKDFAQWKVGKSPDDWETGHTAHWLDQQNQDIDAGKSNSTNPPVTKTLNGKTFIQQNGKWYQQ